MKTIFRLTILVAMLSSLSACAPGETWDYLVMGVMTREATSDIQLLYVYFNFITGAG